MHRRIKTGNAIETTLQYYINYKQKKKDKRKLNWPQHWRSVPPLNRYTSAGKWLLGWSCNLTCQFPEKHLCLLTKWTQCFHCHWDEVMGGLQERILSLFFISSYDPTFPLSKWCMGWGQCIHTRTKPTPYLPSMVPLKHHQVFYSEICRELWALDDRAPLLTPVIF